jgi:dTDP-4-dehydrorhamnose reductase
LRSIFNKFNVDVVIHCAAWTAVDMAEHDDKVEKVRAINAGGTENIAQVCKSLDCKMVYISTDYVFEGMGLVPHSEDKITNLSILIASLSQYVSLGTKDR